jgi:hypothetical protein
LIDLNAELWLVMYMEIMPTKSMRAIVRHVKRWLHCQILYNPPASLMQTLWKTVAAAGSLRSPH